MTRRRVVLTTPLCKTIHRLFFCLPPRTLFKLLKVLLQTELLFLFILVLCLLFYCLNSVTNYAHTFDTKFTQLGAWFGLVCGWSPLYLHALRPYTAAMNHGKLVQKNTLSSFICLVFLFVPLQDFFAIRVDLLNASINLQVSEIRMKPSLVFLFVRVYSAHAHCMLLRCQKTNPAR